MEGGGSEEANARRESERVRGGWRIARLSTEEEGDLLLSSPEEETVG